MAPYSNPRVTLQTRTFNLTAAGEGNRSADLRVGFWVEDAVGDPSDAVCYLWCTPDGHPPSGTLCGDKLSIWRARFLIYFDRQLTRVIFSALGF